jgi:hypothetical protein
MVIDNSIFLYNGILYDPLIFNLSKTGVIKPFFSLGIERTPFEDATGMVGYSGLGEIIAVARSHKWVRTPVVPLPQISAQSQEIRQHNGHSKLEALFIYGAGYDLWNHTKSSGIRKLRRNSTSFNAILDNETPLNVPPPIELSKSTNTQFSPSAAQTPDSGYLWMVDCNVFVDPKDMICNKGDGTCSSSTAITEMLS